MGYTSRLPTSWLRSSSPTPSARSGTRTGATESSSGWPPGTKPRETTRYDEFPDGIDASRAIGVDSCIEALSVTEELSDILDQYEQVPGPLLLVLHAVQRRLGYVPQTAVPYIAERLNLSRAEVHGVLSFYHHFRRAAPGRHVILFCRAESRQAE